MRAGYFPGESSTPVGRSASSTILGRYAKEIPAPRARNRGVTSPSFTSCRAARSLQHQKLRPFFKIYIDPILAQESPYGTITPKLPFETSRGVIDTMKDAFVRGIATPERLVRFTPAHAHPHARRSSCGCVTKCRCRISTAPWCPSPPSSVPPSKSGGATIARIPCPPAGVASCGVYTGGQKGGDGVKGWRRGLQERGDLWVEFAMFMPVGVIVCQGRRCSPTAA